MTQASAGWFPDPDPNATAPSLRYWDGTAWTAYTAPATTQAVAPSGPTTPDGEPLAGWWWRVLAYVIDSVIVGFVTGVASLPAQIRIQQDLQPTLDRFSRQIEQNPETPPDFGAFLADYTDVLQEHMFWLVGPSMIVTMLYWVVFLRWKGGTPGKLMLGMRIRLREQSGRLPWSSIAARLLVQFGIAWTLVIVAVLTASAPAFVVAVVFIVIWQIDPLWATWDSKRQTLHDKLAATNVVKTR